MGRAYDGVLIARIQDGAKSSPHQGVLALKCWSMILDLHVMVFEEVSASAKPATSWRRRLCVAEKAAFCCQLILKKCSRHPDETDSGKEIRH